MTASSRPTESLRSDAAKGASHDALQAWIIAWLGEHLHLAATAIGTGVRLRDLGLDSARATELVAELSARIGRALPLTLLWDHPTIAELTAFLTRAESDVPVPIAFEDRGAATSPDERAIAIIGMACRFPGDASTPEAFWELLAQGRDVVGEVPKDRYDAEVFYDRDPHARGKAVTKWGGFLGQSDTFDPYLFGISPREAVEMDPQQRLLLELAWDAFEGAGIPKEALRDRAVGVFVGSMWNDYARLWRGGPPAIEQFTATGQDDSIISARISYVFGLRGPSMTVNTACSSSLVSVHLAVQSLLAGESEIALAGAVNLIFGPESTLAMSKFGGMAPDGRCKAFDARANGYVRGEGAGVVLLKPLHRALADGDVVHAVIRGSAINNDGFSNGLTSPSPAAQAAMLRSAYARAGISPGQVHYVEAHGTGTMLGDPIEAGALGEVLGRHPDRKEPLRVGSAKTNIGHLEAAAGMAGLVKTVQALKHRKLPPSLHFEKPNPNIAFEDLKLRVQTTLSPWPAGEDEDAPLVAGVSSFGFGGTNAHVVLESSPAQSKSVAAAIADAARKPVFVFTGNGSQYPGMARDLMRRDPIFRQAIARCDESLRKEGCEGIARALERGVFEDERVDLVQPLLWAVQVGLVSMWRAWGIEPAAVVGHSVGEIAAAWAADVLDLDEAARVVVHRSRLQQECAGRGGMVLLEADAETACALIDPGARVTVAARNAHDHTVVSGDSAALGAFIAKATERSIRAKTVRVNVAYHGPQMEPLRARLRDALQELAPSAPRIAMQSTVTGGAVEGRLDAEYWARNMCDPVLFADAIDALIGQGHRLFLEVGPHPTLAKAVEEQLRHAAVGDEVDLGFVATSLEREHESLPRLREALGRLVAHGVAPLPRAQRPRLLPLSAHADAALQGRLDGLREHLRAHPDTDIDAVGHTLARGRSHLSHRCALVASSPAELAQLLDRADLAQAPEVLRAVPLEGRPRVAFVFPGQGSQWLGMGRQLLETEPVFRKAIHRWEPLLAEFTDWSLLEQLQADSATSRLDEVDVIQPMIFAIQVALAALWRSWGVHPDAVIGHSMGEVAAAFVAGALPARDAARIICLRSRIAQKTSGRGGMAVVELSPEDARSVIAPYADSVSLAACNGPTSCLLSGDGAALEAIGATLLAKGVFFRPVKVDYASHSPQMDAIKDELAHALRETTPRPPALHFHSTVDGNFIEDARLDAAYWARNLREPVLFFQGIRALEEAGMNVFLEISPHPVLTYAIAKTVRVEGSLILPSLKRDEDEPRALLASLGTLFAAGGSIDWRALYPEVALPVDLPGYPFQRDRYWFDERDAKAARSPRATGDHAFLDRFVRSPFPEERLIWEADVGLERFPWLADHRVGGVAVFPGTGYIECVLEAAKDLHGDASVELSHLAFEKALFLEAETKTLQLGMEPEGKGHRFSFSSYDAAQGTWTRHVTGELHVSALKVARGKPRSSGAGAHHDARDAEREAVDVRTFYENLERAGNGYGPHFQAVRSLDTSADGVHGQVTLGDGLSVHGTHIHPVVFDACLQVMATPIALRTSSLAGGRASAFMPTRAERIHVFRDAGRTVHSHVRFLDGATVDAATGDLYADIDVTDDHGQLLARVERICFHLLERATQAARPPSELLYRLTWEPSTMPDAVPSAARTWLVFADSRGVSDALVARLSAANHAVHRIHSAPNYLREGNDFHIRPDAPEDYQAVLRAVGHAPAAPLGIVHLWNLELPGGRDTTVRDLRDMATRGCLSVVHLLAALDALALPAPARVWLATCGAWSSSDADRAIAPAQAPVWGLTRAIAQEYPKLWGGIVDLDAEQAPVLEAEHLFAELTTAAGEDRILHRDGARHVARLVRDTAPSPAAAPAFPSDRAYLITGGLGALGLRLAHWMAGRGARHLILLGRKALPPRRTWARGNFDSELRAKIDAILALERLGAHVSTPALDIADGDALNAFLDEHAQESRPPIAGVAHLAGVIRPELLAAVGEDALEAAFASKVYGAWNLHRAFEGSALDFFVLFSSASAVLNSPLLGAYAAANAFLDGLAAFRRSRGEPAQTMNWGFWAEAGMATRDLHFDAAAGETQGMRAFAPATGLELFGALLSRNTAQSVIMDVDWAAWSRIYPDAAASPLLRTLRAAPDAAVAAQSREPAETVRHLRDLPAPERRKAIEDALLDELGAVLKMPASKISKTARFGTMGLDSMLSLELRNRLEKRTGLTLPGTLAWNYPSLDRMTGFFVEQLGESISEPVTSTRADDPPNELLEALFQLGVIDQDDPVLQNPEALRSLIQEARQLLDA